MNEWMRGMRGMGKAPPEFLAQAVAAGFLPLRDHRIHAYGCVYN